MAVIQASSSTPCWDYPSGEFYHQHQLTSLSLNTTVLAPAPFETASLILLLVSAGFLASDYCRYGSEEILYGSEPVRKTLFYLLLT
jgi:hypothetical protein